MSAPTLIRDAIEKAFNAATRKTIIDKQPHFIPLNLDALKITLGHVIATSQEDVAEDEKDSFASRIISLEDLRAKIIAYVKAKHKYSIVVHSGESISVEVGGKVIEGASIGQIATYYTPAIMYMHSISDDNLVGTLYSSYNAAGSGLFATFLNKEISGFIKSTIYEGPDNYTKRFNIGHILNKADPIIANTPLYLKAQKLVEALNKISDINVEFPGIPSQYRQSNVEGVSKIKDKVKNLLDTFGNNSTYGPRILVTLDKDFSGVLAKVGANIVIIQDEYENQGIYARLVEGPLSKAIRDLLSETTFSRNFKQEINYRLSSALKGTLIEKGPKVKKTLKDISPFKSKISSKATTSKSSNIVLPSIKPSPSTTSYSLASLQTLINDSLQNVISANMGSGSSSSILNYQTGRFAASVNVERMSQSREGMITAFYSYMKNPYATFSEGGVQSSPKTRDPKLLISKSIREIAATKIGNRLRAIQV